MNKHLPSSLRLPFIATIGSLALGLLLITGCASTDEQAGTPTWPEENPEISFDGLVRLENTRAGAVWKLPEADLAGYTKVGIIEPQITFRSDWESRINQGRAMSRRLTERDIETIIANGQNLFMEEFRNALEAGGYEISEMTGPDVLLVRPMITNLDIVAPDPNNEGMWNRVYTDRSNSATLILELRDSQTMEILVRGVDSWRGVRGSWHIPRTRAMNVADARQAFSRWAAMLVNGLDIAMESSEEE